MLSGLLFSALIAATPATYSTSPERTLCVEAPPMSLVQPLSQAQPEQPLGHDSGLDEPEADPADALPAATGATNCSEPPLQSTPAVIDCNDARSSKWVDFMIGSCDMPRGAAPPSLKAQRATTVICDLLSCGNGTPPLRGVVRPPEEVHLFAAVPVLLTLVFDASPLDERSFSMPRSVEGPPPERPPRAHRA